MSKQTKPKATEPKAIKRLLSNNEAREFANKSMIGKNDPVSIINTMTKEVNDGLQSDRKESQLDLDSASYKYVMMQNLDNHYLLSLGCDETYQPLVINFAKDLIKEYDCRTPSEKALAQVTVNAYYRILRCSSALNSRIWPGDISHEKASYFSITSKELDRANRQFLTALQTLKQIKQPAISMNVKANTAYLAQNQQINTADPLNPTSNKPKDEAIEQQ